MSVALEQAELTPIAQAFNVSADPYSLGIARYGRAPLAFVREILGAEPDAWQAEALRALARGETRLSVRSGHGVGKALALHTIVPTPDGRRMWREVQPGQKLFGGDGKPVTVTARIGQPVLPMVRVFFDDATSVDCSENHLWTYRTAYGRGSHEFSEWRTEETAAIWRSFANRPRGQKWLLPTPGLAVYPYRVPPVQPHLFGAWLGGGEVGTAAARYLSTGLRKLELEGVDERERLIPRSLLEGDANTRLSLMNALMDARGYFDHDRKATLAVQSIQLARDACELVRSLGGKAYLLQPLSGQGMTVPRSVDERSFYLWRGYYHVRILMPPGVPTFGDFARQSSLDRPAGINLARHILGFQQLEPAECMCVTVDAEDGLFLANDYIPTHNSAFAAWVMTWFANTRAPMKIGVTAPSAPQLFDTLWPELGTWFNRLPPAWRALWDITADRVSLKSNPDSCFITARTARADKPEALQGLHSDYVMLVVDEASGVDEPVFEAARGSMSTAGAVTVLLGNPTRSTGFFWRTHNLERDRWWCRRVSSADSPRVAKEFIEEIAGAYGLNSNAYRVRVLGEFPLADEDTLIAAALVEGAMTRDVALDLMVPEIWGLDVARFGLDSSSLVKRRGNVVTEMPRRWHNTDTMQLAGAVKAEWDIVGPRNRPGLIVVDVIGIGAGVVDRLAEQNLPVLGCNVAEQPSMQARYMRLRDELWDRAREWLETRQCRLPRDDKFRDALCAPRYTFLSDGKMQIESKVSMRSRGLPSPDDADAFCLTFAAQELGVTSGHSGGIYDRSPVRDAIPGME